MDEESVMRKLDEMEKKKKRNIILAIITIVVFGVVVILISNAYEENLNKNSYITAARELYGEIETCILDAELDVTKYEDAISLMKDYEEEYTALDEYYEYIPEEMKPNMAIRNLKEKLIYYLEDPCFLMYTNLEVAEHNQSANYDQLVTLENCLSTMVSNYEYLSDGVQQIDVKQDFEEKLINCKYTKALILYNRGDKGQGIALLKDLKEYYDLDSDMTKNVNTTLNKMLANSRATDFEIVSGSSNISVFKSGKNFGWRCPYCGYSTSAVGTNSIVSQLDEHYAGEVSTYSGAMVCASAYRGGCSEMSRYSLTIKYK